MTMCDCGHGADVHQRQCGIARAFDPYQLCLARPDQVFDFVFYTGGECDFDTVSVGYLSKVAVGAAVDTGDGDDMGALGEGLKYCRCGCGARGEGEGVCGVFEGCYRCLKIVSGNLYEENVSCTISHGYTYWGLSF